MTVLKKLILLVIAVCVCEGFSQTLRLASWNVRCIEKKDSLQGDAWSKRVPEIAKLIRFLDFEIVGMQEVDSVQHSDLFALLPEYRWVPQSTEGNPIIYLADRFDLMDHGAIWYSAGMIPGVKGWDAKHPRFCIWARFKDKKYGNDFFVFNAHWDHKGDTSRVESAKMTTSLLPRLALGRPFFFMGDLNSKPNRRALKIMEESGFNDARKEASMVYASRPSFNHFRDNNPEDSNYDYIYFVGPVDVSRFGVMDNTYWDGKTRRYPSDHFPIMAEIKFR